MSYVRVVLRNSSTNTCRSSCNVSVTLIWFQSVQLVLKLLHMYIYTCTEVRTNMRMYLPTYRDAWRSEHVHILKFILQSHKKWKHLFIHAPTQYMQVCLPVCALFHDSWAGFSERMSCHKHYKETVWYHYVCSRGS